MDHTNVLPPDLEDEITSINSIFHADTLTFASARKDVHTTSLILALPQTPLSLLINFPNNYPAEFPVAERITHIDDTLPKGYGSKALTLAQNVLEYLKGNPSQAGAVVIYDFIENLESKIAESLLDVPATTVPDTPVRASNTSADEKTGLAASQWADPQNTEVSKKAPEWILSEPLISHKSTFLARACAVQSPQEAHAATAHLLATDKRAAKATHNMWAFRIRKATAAGSGSAEIVYADADDDGEDGAGAKLAALLQAMGAWGVLVVVSRWYGGVKLGPERWRLIGNVGREVLVKGGEVDRWQLEKMTKG